MSSTGSANIYCALPVGVYVLGVGVGVCGCVCGIKLWNCEGVYSAEYSDFLKLKKQTAVIMVHFHWPRHCEPITSYWYQGYFKVELPLWKAKNRNFRLELMEKLPFRCFLFDVNRSFRSKVTVKNVTFQSEITCHISYVFHCFLKLLFLIFFTLKFNISRVTKILISNFHNYMLKYIYMFYNA